MLRLLEIVLEMDRIEMRLEEIEAAQETRFKQGRKSSYSYQYRCPLCSAIIVVDALLKVPHHHICPECCEIVELKIILRHLIKEEPIKEEPTKEDQEDPEDPEDPDSSSSIP